ncbi:hypothetical protein [Actinocorallia libanotica]|uniref:Uncharacterized protein n=1 Tax=Actinocorallia libanotica TaxID=46162 RepID=A0ABN1R5U5_9ACTN
MTGSILPPAAFLAVLTITIFVLVMAFYFDDPQSRPDEDRRWSRRY